MEGPDLDHATFIVCATTIIMPGPFSVFVRNVEVEKDPEALAEEETHQVRQTGGGQKNRI